MKVQIQIQIHPIFQIHPSENVKSNPNPQLWKSSNQMENLLNVDLDLDLPTIAYSVFQISASAYTACAS